MLTPEQKARLSKLDPEQQVIAEKWEKEREERDKLIEILAKAEQEKDNELFRSTLDKMLADTPSMCEHERSIWSNCASCDEIGQALNPELYCAKCCVPWSIMGSDEEEKEHKEGDICSDCLYEENE